MIESQKEEICRAHQGDERLRQDHQLLHEQVLKQTWDLREAHEESLSEMEELKRFQGSTYSTQLPGENLSKIEILSLNSLARYRNYRMKSMVCTIRGIFKMLNQYAVDIPTLSVDQCHSHLTRYLEECCDNLSYRRAAEKGRQAFGTHAISGNVFAYLAASSSAPYPQELNPWSSHISEPIHSSQTRKNENLTPVQDQRCQSGPSAKNSFVLSEGIFSENYGADQQRLQISDLHFNKFTTPATFACCKIRFKTEVRTCSQFPSEAMLWIKEVEMVDSVDDLMSSSSIRGISVPNFEVLEARIASALNKIIHNSHFKRMVSLEEQKVQKEDRFLRGRQIAYLIYEYFRGHWSQ